MSSGVGLTGVVWHCQLAKSKTDVTPAILSRDKIASVTLRVTQVFNSRATPPNGAMLYSVQLCRETVVNVDWPILVYATKLHCAKRNVTLAILWRDKVAREKAQV